MGCLQATEVIKLLLGKEGVCSGRVLVFDALKMKFSEIGLSQRKEREAITKLIDYQGFCAGPKTTTSDNVATTSKELTMALSTVSENGNTIVPTSFDLLKARAGALKDAALQGATSNGRTMDEVDSPATTAEEEDAFHSIAPKQCLQKLVDGWTPRVLDVRLETEHDIVALPFTDKVVPHRTVLLEHVPKSGDILVYCKGGVRGKKACSRLIELGVDADRLYNLEGGIMAWQKDVDPAMPRY